MSRAPSPKLGNKKIKSDLHDDARKTRGQDVFAALLSCRALSSPTTCRFIPAHSEWPTIRPRTPAANRYRERFRVAQELLIGVIRSVPNAPPPTSGSSCRDCAGQAPGRVKKDGERTALCEGELLHLIANGFREPSSQAPPRTLCLQRGQTARGLGQDVHPCPAASSARWPGRRCRESTIGSPVE